MKQSQAERLNKVLIQDKSASPERLLPALKSDLRDILREYGELAGDIMVNIEDDQSGYDVVIMAKVTRFKSYGNIISG